MSEEQKEVDLPDVGMMSKILEFSEALTMHKIPFDSVAFKVSREEARILAGELIEHTAGKTDINEKLVKAVKMNYAPTQVHGCTILGIEILVKGMK